jgi:hypothetical protein
MGVILNPLDWMAGSQATDMMMTFQGTYPQQELPLCESLIPFSLPPKLSGGEDLIAQNISTAREYFNSQFAANPETALPALMGFLTAKFRPGGEWDYKYQTEYDAGTAENIAARDFGNFYFGAVMQALGFNYYFTQNAGGAAQIVIWATGGTPGTCIPGLTYPYGDQVEDAIVIRSGFEYEEARRSGTCR